MDDARSRNEPSKSARGARIAGAVLAALSGGAVALFAVWSLAPQSLERFAPRAGDLAWLAIGAAGGLLGLGAGALLRAVTRGLRAGHAARRLDVPPLDAAAPADPARGAWLQVIAADRADLAARAAFEVAAHALATRRRVVLIDGSRDFRLHDCLGLSGRLGFRECMAGGLPALGLLQSGGFTGLFLLARGRQGNLEDWLPLDRVLEELRPHFEQVVLVFERRVPAVVGGVLAGRLASGWWAGPGKAAGRGPRSASAALAIPLFDIDLAAMPHPSLEALEARLAGVLAAPADAAVLEPFAAAPPGPIRVSPPAVLDCDLQVRQRLRFLAWMRRMRTERERAETAGRS